MISFRVSVLAFWIMNARCAVDAQETGVFQAPLSIRSETIPGPLVVHTGDFNGDSKRDLVSASGTSTVLVLLQDSLDRTHWSQIGLQVGVQSIFAIAADFDGDGLDDIAVADPSSAAYLIRSRGAGRFAEPARIAQTNGARWLTAGDYNGDRHVDLVVASLATLKVQVLLGDGTGAMAPGETLSGDREHTIETADWNGDGIPDLLLGTGLSGITPYRGRGDGTFEPGRRVENLGCVEYLAVGDIDGDGKDDCAPTCIDFANAFVGISQGNGTFQQTLETLAGGGTDYSAIGDFDGDGKKDVALVSQHTTSLLVYRGKGDGTLEAAVEFGPTGLVPAFLAADDLDADGRDDVVSADSIGGSFTVFWGSQEQQFLESGIELHGIAQAKAMAAGDFDGDGAPDLAFPRGTTGVIDVYRGPIRGQLSGPDLSIADVGRFTSLEAADLDGDGRLDLFGTHETAGLVRVAFFDVGFQLRNVVELPAGISPVAVRVGRLNGDTSPDLVAASRGSAQLSIFFGSGGTFGPRLDVPTVAKVRRAIPVDLDGDTSTDLVAVGDNTVAVHRSDGSDGANGAGGFSAPRVVLEDFLSLFLDAAVADVTADGVPDILVVDQKGSDVLVLAGRGGLAFDFAGAVTVGKGAVALALADLNGDGLLDLTSANQVGRSLSVALNMRGSFAEPVAYAVGIPIGGHRIADFDGDGALDVAAFSSSAGVVLLGRPSTRRAGFLRGDPTGDGAVDLSDAIFVLRHLFLSDPAPACADAADADDSGQTDLTDAIFALNYLFLAGEPPPEPGPARCGADPTPDLLPACGAACR